MKSIRITPQSLKTAQDALSKLPCDGSMEIVIREYKKHRSLQQNRLMWKLINEVSEKVIWYGEKLTPENWKDVLTASLKKQTVVPGIDGGFVVCGTSTSKMTVKELNELIELTIAFGTQQGVKFSAQDGYY